MVRCSNSVGSGWPRNSNRGVDSVLQSICFSGHFFCDLYSVCAIEMGGAIPLYRTDIKIKEKLVKKHPGQPEHAIALAEAYRNFGAALQNQGKNAKANSLYAKAVHLERKQAAVPRQFHKF